MKQINFNDKRILKSLLDKSKTMFIEPAFRKCQGCYKCEYLRGDGECEHIPEDYYDKPCKYKEGETYEVVWKKDNEYDWFCKCHGIGYDNTGKLPRQRQIKDMEYFNKHLGKVKVLKIEKIEICPDYDYITYPYGLGIWSEDDKRLDSWNKKDNLLSKSLGDNSPEAMFKRLSEMGDLSTPKPFWLITKEWLK